MLSAFIGDIMIRRRTPSSKLLRLGALVGLAILVATAAVVMQG
jgi:hypothetical protein